MVKQETKKCEICQQQIHLDKDDYCHLEDFHKGKFFIEGYYHTNCFNQGLKRNQEMRQMAASLLGKANSLLKELQGDEKEVVVIK